jgi:hypothetical protein
VAGCATLTRGLCGGLGVGTLVGAALSPPPPPPTHTHSHTHLESEVEGLGGEVADHVGQVAAPEGGHALLPRHTGKAVDNARVAGDLAALDLGVGVLGLKEELHTLDGSDCGLRDGTSGTACREISEEAEGRAGGLPAAVVSAGG